MLSLHAASRTVLAVGERDFSVVEFQQRFLHQILNLFDVDEKRAFTSHSEFNLSLHLASDRFVFPLSHTSRSDSVCDFMTEPRNHPWLAGSVARDIATNDPRELYAIVAGRFVAEDELRIR